MNKKNILQSIKVIVLGLVVAVGVSYAFAQPGDNVPGPLNVGSSNQAKLGGFAVGTATWPIYINKLGVSIPSTAKLEVKGVTSIDALSVWYNSTLLGDVGIGGLYTAGNKLTVSGNTKVIGSMKITTLNPATESPICVTATGQLQLCTP